MRRIRRERGPDNVLLVDGGDTFSDDLLGNLTRGEAVIRLMNSLGYQLMALGNQGIRVGFLTHITLLVVAVLVPLMWPF